VNCRKIFFIIGNFEDKFLMGGWGWASLGFDVLNEALLGDVQPA
jgi:hypothetical protein